MAKSGNSISKTLVWILMAMLVVGLAGFGATNLSGTLRTIGSVGDKEISIDLYARTLQEDLRALSAQAGQQVPFSTAQQIGIDRQALSRVVTIRALDHETAQLGLSVGDAELQKQILSMNAFQGPTGQFDRNAYKYALENAGMSEPEFEEGLREEAARTLVQGAILAGIAMPDTYADTLAAFIGERRNATVARLTEDDLATPIAEPTEADLQTYYDENIAEYTVPETKKITYAWLLPDMIADTVEVDEDALRKAYDERSAEFNTPERRLVERLAFATEDDAKSAKAQLEAGGTTFETLVEDRGLALSDVDMGDVDATTLGAAADAVFAAETGDVVGPLTTDLGPALFRVNGVLAAHSVSFDEARDDLRAELAADRARRVVDSKIGEIDDLLAGGATLEELTGETDLELGSIDWSSEAEDGIAAYDAFRAAAEAVTLDDFPEVVSLEDGGIFAMRLNEVVAPHPMALEEVKERVTTGWTTAATRKALLAQAKALVETFNDDTDLGQLGLDATALTDLTRSGFTEAVPASALSEIFATDAGGIVIAEDVSSVVIARVDEILPADMESDDISALRERLSAQAGNSVGLDLFEAFATDIQQRAGIKLDQNAINAVHANFQ